MNLAGLAALLTLLTGPAALASHLRPDPPWWFQRWPQPARRAGRPHRPPLPAPAHSAASGGPPSWQIALAVAAVVLLAVAAARMYRLRAARRARPRAQAGERHDDPAQTAATHPLVVQRLPGESGWPSATVPPDEVSWP